VSGGRSSATGRFPADDTAAVRPTPGRPQGSIERPLLDSPDRGLLRDPSARRVGGAPAESLTAPDVRFAVRLTPRSAVDAVIDVVDGALHVRVRAPAVDGAANTALVRLLADTLGVARSDVRIVAGATGRRKLVAIDGLGPEAIVARWPDLQV